MGQGRGSSHPFFIIIIIIIIIIPLSGAEQVFIFKQERFAAGAEVGIKVSSWTFELPFCAKNFISMGQKLITYIVKICNNPK
jgi:hypothetical protein